MKRTAICLAAAVVCLSLAWMSPHDAEAVQVTWGELISANGPTTTDWELQGWIDQYFEDGSKGDGVVISKIVVVGTTPYFGDFIDNFNDTTGDPVGGASLDTVSFNAGTIGWISATSPGEPSYMNGFHTGAAQALDPALTLVDVFDKGVATKHANENPTQFGANLAIGGLEGTHVLIYAGTFGPTPPHTQMDIDAVTANFASEPNTTVTTLAGSAATPANLKAAIQNIGAQVNSPFKQFILFTTGHGANTTLDFGSVAGGTEVDPQSAHEVPIDLSLDDVGVWIADPGNLPQLVLLTSVPISTLTDVIVEINGQSFGDLSGADLSQLELPDGSTANRYALTMLDESLLNQFFTTNTIRIDNRSATESIFLVGAGIHSGAVARIIPEPSTVILAAIGLVGLAAFGWRRRKR